MTIEEENRFLQGVAKGLAEENERLQAQRDALLAEVERLRANDLIVVARWREDREEAERLRAALESLDFLEEDWQRWPWMIRRKLEEARQAFKELEEK
jgi:hypothetical protein